MPATTSNNVSFSSSVDRDVEALNLDADSDSGKSNSRLDFFVNVVVIVLALLSFCVVLFLGQHLYFDLHTPCPEAVITDVHFEPISRIELDEKGLILLRSSNPNRCDVIRDDNSDFDSESNSGNKMHNNRIVVSYDERFTLLGTEGMTLCAEVPVYVHE